MKKTLAMLLALAMSLSLLTGCGSKKDDAPAADNSDAAAGETTGEAKPRRGHEDRAGVATRSARRCS